MLHMIPSKQPKPTAAWPDEADQRPRRSTQILNPLPNKVSSSARSTPPSLIVVSQHRRQTSPTKQSPRTAERRRSPQGARTASSTGQPRSRLPPGAWGAPVTVTRSRSPHREPIEHPNRDTSESLVLCMSPQQTRAAVRQQIPRSPPLRAAVPARSPTRENGRRGVGVGEIVSTSRQLLESEWAGAQQRGFSRAHSSKVVCSAEASLSWTCPF